MGLADQVGRGCVIGANFVPLLSLVPSVRTIREGTQGQQREELISRLPQVIRQRRTKTSPCRDSRLTTSISSSRRDARRQRAEPNEKESCVILAAISPNLHHVLWMCRWRQRRRSLHNAKQQEMRRDASTLHGIKYAIPAPPRDDDATTAMSRRRRRRGEGEGSVPLPLT